MAGKIKIIRGTKGIGMGLFAAIMTYKLRKYLKQGKVLGGKG